MLLLATVGAHEYLQYAESVRHKATEKVLGPSWDSNPKPSDLEISHSLSKASSFVISVSCIFGYINCRVC